MAQGTGIGTEAMLDLGNEQDVADHVLRAHGGRYETAALEVSSVAEREEEGGWRFGGLRSRRVSQGKRAR